MKELIINLKEMRLKDIDLEELDEAIEILSGLRLIKKNMNDYESGRTTRLKQGKRQPILMVDTSGNIVEKFPGFTACARYLRNELGVKNQENKLREALDDSEKTIAGFTFQLLAEE